MVEDSYRSSKKKTTNDSAGAGYDGKAAENRLVRSSVTFSIPSRVKSVSDFVFGSASSSSIQGEQKERW